MKKKFLATLLAFIMIIPTSFTAHAAGVSDIDSHWAQKEIQYFIDKGFIVGYEDGTFRPDKTVTRAEFVRIVNMAFGFTDAENIKFKDVRANDWYYKDVAIGVKAGVISGYGDNTFRPNNNITREETASIIVRLAKLTYDNNHANQTYSDISKTSFYNGQLGAVTSTGVMKGVTDKLFAPTSLETRGDTAYSLYNALLLGNGKNEFFDGTLYVRESSYGENDDSRIEQITGNVVVRSSDSTVTLRNISVIGDLTISGKCKRVDLDNVNVNGKLIINGGTDILLRNSYAKICDLNNDSQITTKVDLTSGSNIHDFNVYTSCVLTEDLNDFSTGFDNVIVQQTASTTKKPMSVDLYGRFVVVDVFEPKSTINLNRGDISNLYFYHTASDSIANIKTGTHISDFVVNAANLDVKGSGTIAMARVDADKVKFEQEPENINGLYAPTIGNKKDSDSSSNNDYDEDDYSLIITVLNKDGVPVKDAKVKVDGTSKTTDEIGEAKFDKLKDGRYDYSVTHSYFTTSDDNTVTVSSKSTARQTVKLSTSKTYDLTINVEDYSTGDTINSVKVDLKEIDYDTTSSGKVVFSDLYPGNYTYVVTKSGYKTQTNTINITNADKRETIRLKEGKSEDDSDYQLVITVTNDDDFPVYDAVVKAGSKTEYTDKEGKARFKSMSSGTVDYTVKHDDFKDASGSVTVKTSSTATKTVTLVERETYDLTIRVEDYNDGDYIDDATVKITDLKTQYTNSSGKTSYTSLLPGVYSYTISKSGYETKSGEIVVQDKDITETIELKTDNKYSARFNVTDYNTDEDLKGVVIKMDSKSATTNSSGVATITGLTTGTYTVTAKLSGYEDYSKSIKISSSGTTDFDIELKPATTKTLTVKIDGYESASKLKIFLTNTKTNEVTTIDSASASKGYSIISGVKYTLDVSIGSGYSFKIDDSSVNSKDYTISSNTTTTIKVSKD